jgi:hypothetical protein
MLIDKALTGGYVLSLLAAAHHRWEGLVFARPSIKGKRKWPSPNGGQGNNRFPYERKSSPAVGDRDRTRTSSPIWSARQPPKDSEC